MLFGRQKRVLALVDALGGEVGNLDFQKLLFLYCREVEETPSYEFIPYKFGGFSFTSYADKRRLIEQSLLEGEERMWKLTTAGRAVGKVPPMVRVGMDQFARRKAGLRGEALVAEAYRRHPYYAIRSEIADQLLAGDDEARAAIAAARPAANNPGLCTIGYEGRTLEGYLNQLLRAGVTLLCDVRRNPLSRKYGFSKSTLSKGCEVRQAASVCFRQLSDENLTAESALIGTYLDSPAFNDGADQLVYALEKSTALLPDVVCAIPNRIMDREAKAGTPLHSRHDLYQLPELVLRVYRQTGDDATKTRCLDTMDRMLEAGLSGLESELGKVER